VVKTGHTISRIAQCRVGMPIYSRAHGSLAQILQENPEIKNPDRIFLGQEIRLPASSENYQPLAKLSCERDFEMATAEAPLMASAEPFAIPSAERAPAAEETPLVAANRGDEVYSLLSLSPILSFSRLDGTDLDTNGKATLVSDMNYGFFVKWTQVWSKSFRTFLDTRWNRITIRSTESGDSISPTKDVYANFGGGAEFRLADQRIGVGAGVHSGQEMFYRASSATEIHIDKVMLYSGDLHANYKVLENSALGLSLDLKYSWLLPSSTTHYKIHTGNRVSGTIDIAHHIGRSRWGAGIGYGISTYSSTLSKQKRSDVFLNVCWETELGK
jgi:hypothetical protein